MTRRASLIAFGASALLAATAAALPAQELSWRTIDGGGGTSSGGGFEVSGSIGQADAGPTLTAAAFEVTGGFWTAPGAAPPECIGDIDGGGVIDFGDLLAVLSAWGACEGCPEDLDGNDVVDFGDLLVVLSNWGPCV